MTPRPAADRHDPFAAWRGSCRSCRAALIWTVTTDGKRMPVEEKPNQLRGNVILMIEEAAGDQPARVLAAVLTEGQVAGVKSAGRKLYLSHFVSCPNADGYRRSRSKTRRWRRT